MRDDETLNWDGRLETFYAETVHVYVQQLLQDYPELAKNARVHCYAHHTTKALALQITSWCLTGRIPTRTEDVTVEYPNGWWQMFKQSFMPQWFTARFPVKMKVIKVQTSTHHYFVCPHVSTPATGDGFKTHIKFMATGTPLSARMG
jgi:hypothetical protein